MSPKPEKTLDPASCLDAGATCACFNLRRAARAVTQYFDDRLRPSGLRATQFSLLAATRVHEPVPVSRLAEITLVDRTTLTRNLGLLERQGLLRIDPGRDRRVRSASLTDRGRRALLRAFPLWKGAQEAVVGRLGTNRLRHLLAGLAAAVEATREG